MQVTWTLGTWITVWTIRVPICGMDVCNCAARVQRLAARPVGEKEHFLLWYSYRGAALASFQGSLNLYTISVEVIPLCFVNNIWTSLYSQTQHIIKNKIN
jgi:hypothetical protein